MQKKIKQKRLLDSEKSSKNAIVTQPSNNNSSKPKGQEPTTHTHAKYFESVGSQLRDGNQTTTNAEHLKI